jgi:ABC-type polysaccharide/polyol phosphate transport system ATPase subunit/predicted O-linked N-acetylglucosamine transferase (SPINDLY family)
VTALITLERVGKDYPKILHAGDRFGALAGALLGRPPRHIFTALDGVDLKVLRGESLGVIGENGSGKSTLLKMIAGVAKPTRGSVTVNGRVGALLELGSGFHPDYTGRENILLSSALAGLSRSELDSRVDSIVAFADIGSHIDEPVRHYSSGMAVRLGFAVATAMRPDVLITDEVLAVGDESFQRKCVRWLEGFLANGGTVLLCSHSMFHIQTLCQHALWLHQGQVRQYGDAFTVARDYLAWHHDKATEKAPESLPPEAKGPIPCVLRTWLEDGDGRVANEFAHGSALVLKGVVYEPEDRAPTVLVGIVRSDGTPVYGTHSNDGDFVPNRIGPHEFGFAWRLPQLNLLPGKYSLRAHALDPEGLRMFHTLAAEFMVSGRSRDYGVCRLEHEWVAAAAVSALFFIEQAKRQLAARDLDAALASCVAATDADRRSGEAWFLRGTVELARGLAGEARLSAAEAIAIAPADPRYQVLAGNAAEELRQMREACSAYREAARLAPGWALAWNRLGTACAANGELQEAAAAFRQAVALDPAHVWAWNNLGHVSLETGDLDGAENAFRQALLLKPDYALGYYNLARVLRQRGDLEGAAGQATLASQLDPRAAGAALLLADLDRRRGDAAAAQARYEAILAAQPDLARPRNLLAELLAETGLAREAQAQYRIAEKANPASLRAALGANLLLPPVYEGGDDLRAWREGYDAGLARLQSDTARFASAGADDIGSDAQWSNFYLAYQGGDDRDLQRRYGEFICAQLARAFPRWSQPMPRRAGAKLRVGFFSHFHFDCTVGRYFASWVTGLDRARCEAFVYHTNEWQDELTQRIGAGANFRALAGRSLAAMAEAVAGDALDLLVFPELGMHAPTFALAALRLAPVQVCAWGHPSTSGLPTIDHFLSVQGMEPEGAQSAYTEALHLLPGLGTRYARPGGAATGTNAPPLPEGHRYLVPQSLFKIHPDNDALFARLLEADARAQLILFAARQPAVTEAFKRRLAARLDTSRLAVLPYLAHPSYLAVNDACHVMLDTLHWSGGNTSLDALASALPVVALPGRLMRGRQSSAMLAMMGLDGELVARDERDYVDRAVALASDDARRIAMGRRIRDAAPLLFDREEPLRALHELFERLAR